MAESIIPEEWHSGREEEIKGEGEKATLLLTARRLKSGKVCGSLQIVLVKLVLKCLRNATHS